MFIYIYMYILVYVYIYVLLYSLHANAFLYMVLDPPTHSQMTFSEGVEIHIYIHTHNFSIHAIVY